MVVVWAVCLKHTRTRTRTHVHLDAVGSRRKEKGALIRLCNVFVYSPIAWIAVADMAKGKKQAGKKVCAVATCAWNCHD